MRRAGPQCLSCEVCNGTGREGGKNKLDKPEGIKQVRGVLAACAIQ